jgi:hypothetical protein
MLVSAQPDQAESSVAGERDTPGVIEPGALSVVLQRQLAGISIGRSDRWCKSASEKYCARIIEWYLNADGPGLSSGKVIRSELGID